MTAFDLFSIGHSNIAAERFVAMLRAAGVDAVADVRTTPFSRFCPWFSGKNLAPLLERERLSYLFYGDTLGGRPKDPALYCDGVADYEAMARQDEFRQSLDRLIADGTHRRLCLMCAEREPLDCHRCLLVARALAARGLTVGHIRHDGAIEPHTVTERRLLELAGGEGDLFATDDRCATGHPSATRHADRLAAAYRRRGRAAAYRTTKPA